MRVRVSNPKILERVLLLLENYSPEVITIRTL